ncbi:MAG: hypothetical protein WDO70_00015 [Alphaproteobacteria bacterium]
MGYLLAEAFDDTKDSAVRIEFLRTLAEVLPRHPAIATPRLAASVSHAALYETRTEVREAALEIVARLERLGKENGEAPGQCLIWLTRASAVAQAHGYTGPEPHERLMWMTCGLRELPRPDF